MLCGVVYMCVCCVPVCSRVPSTFASGVLHVRGCGTFVWLQRSLGDPLQLCAIQNAVLHASTEFSTALILLPLPTVPLPDAVVGGYRGGAANEWLSMVSELGTGLPPTLFVYNPTTGVIATHI